MQKQKCLLILNNLNYQLIKFFGLIKKESQMSIFKSHKIDFKIFLFKLQGTYIVFHNDIKTLIFCCVVFSA